VLRLALARGGGKILSATVAEGPTVPGELRGDIEEIPKQASPGAFFSASEGASGVPSSAGPSEGEARPVAEADPAIGDAGPSATAAETSVKAG
jgi:hypothetical protein